MVQRNAPPFASLLSLSSGSPSLQLQPPGCTAEAPQKPLSRRGGIPEQQKRAGSKHSSAPITAKCQSFLDNLVAQIAGNRARAIMSPSQSHDVCWNGRDHQIVVQK